MASTSPPSVLIIGASGYLGKPMCGEFLAQRSKFKRIAILTTEEKKAKFAKVEADGLELVLGSFTDPSSFKGFDIVLCLVGNALMKLQPHIIDAAIKGGATEFYPSEFGSDIAQGSYLTSRYMRDKHLTRGHCRAAAKKHPGFNYTFIMCGGFSEFALHPWFGTDIEKHTFTLYGDPSAQDQQMTAVRDVARYTIETMLLPKKDGGERQFRVVGCSHTWTEIIDELSRIQGVEYTREVLPHRLVLDKAAQCAKDGDVDGELLYSLKAIISGAEGLAVPKPWDNDLFSFKPEPLGTSFARYLAEQKNGKTD